MLKLNILKKIIINEYFSSLYKALLEYYDEDILLIMFENILNSPYKDYFLKVFSPINNRISDTKSIIFGCNKSANMFYVMDIVQSVKEENCYHIYIIYNASDIYHLRDNDPYQKAVNGCNIEELNFIIK